MPQFTKLQLQKIRRHKAKEEDLKNLFNTTHIECCKFDKIVNATVDELDNLTAFIKKIKIHRKATDRMITEHLIIPQEIKEEVLINTGMYEHLNNVYNGILGKRLKYKYCHRKDKFRETVISDNQLQFNNCLSIEIENTIKKFFNDIDISSYEPTTRDLEKEKKEREAKRKIIMPKPQPEIIIPEPLSPPIPEHVITKPKRTKPKPKPKSKPIEIIPEPTSDSDSDIEEDVKRLESRENTDQDDNTPYDIKQWQTKIYRLWKDEIDNALNSPNDYENDEAEEKGFNNIINIYINRTKAQIRGRTELIGLWAGRNPVSLKKIIVSIVKKIQKKYKYDM